MPILRLIGGPKRFFFGLQAATHSADKCEIWHWERPPGQNFTFIGAEMWDHSLWVYTA